MTAPINITPKPYYFYTVEFMDIYDGSHYFRLIDAPVNATHEERMARFDADINGVMTVTWTMIGCVRMTYPPCASGKATGMSSYRAPHNPLTNWKRIYDQLSTP